jgi:hypothetical protein
MFFFFCNNWLVSIKMNISINDLYIKLERTQLENIWIQIWAVITECAADLFDSIKRRNYKILWVVQANFWRSHIFSTNTPSVFLMVCRGRQWSSHWTPSLLQYSPHTLPRGHDWKMWQYTPHFCLCYGHCFVTSLYRNRSFHVKTIKFTDVISGGYFEARELLDISTEPVVIISRPFSIQYIIYNVFVYAPI